MFSYTLPMMLNIVREFRYQYEVRNHEALWMLTCDG